MGRRLPPYLALALLLLAGTIDGGYWWTRHDAELLDQFRRAPVVGRYLERALGAEARRQEVLIAVDASYPPFASVEATGELVGFEVDLARELGRRLANAPRVVNMDAGDGLIDALAARKIDAIIAGLDYSDQAAKEAAFSEEYFEAGPVILARRERIDIKEPRDLRKKMVAVESGSLGEEEARKLGSELGGMELTPMDDLERVVAAVAEGKVDAAVLDRAVIPVGAPGLAGIQRVGSPLRSRPYRIAVRRKDPALLMAINRELVLMKQEGTLAEMERRWFP